MTAKPITQNDRNTLATLNGWQPMVNDLLTEVQPWTARRQGYCQDGCREALVQAWDRPDGAVVLVVLYVVHQRETAVIVGDETTTAIESLEDGLLERGFSRDALLRLAHLLFAGEVQP